MKNRKFTNEFVIIISRTANTIDKLNPFKACANNGCATQKAQDRNQWICTFLYSISNLVFVFIDGYNNNAFALLSSKILFLIMYNLKNVKKMFWKHFRYFT